MTMLQHTLPVVLLLAAAATAQSVVSPRHFTSSEGATSNSFPFGVNTTPFRYANLHDDITGTPRLIRGMALRRNATSAAAAAFSVTLDAWMSTATTTGAAPNATFDSNHGTDKAQIVMARTYNFPASPVAFVPEPFVFILPYDVPFMFGGTASLCWEAQVTARTNTTSYFLDAVSGTGSTNPAMAVSAFGTGCLATGRTAAMSATGTSSMNWAASTGTLTVNGTEGPASAPIAMILGANNLPNPILIPGSDTAPSGSCFVYTDFLLTLSSTTTAAGTSTFSIPFTANPAFNGLRVFEQLASIDVAANPFGLVTSRAVNHNVVAPYGAIPGGRVYSSGSLGATGTVGANFTLIVRFDS